jgi:hypothetical protein
MAEPTSPAEEPRPDARRAADPPASFTSEETPVLLQPPTEEELAATGEPTPEEIHAAAGTDAEVAPASAADVRHADSVEAAPAPDADVRPADGAAVDRPQDSEPAPAVARPLPADPAPPAPPAPAAAQPVLAPAVESPPPPRARGNRVVGTAWVLLAAGLFQVLYFGALALIILLLGGVAAVAPGLANITHYPFAWLPVLFFFLFFELTVLLFNRAGRFAYVVASLIVGLLVYIVSVLLISILIGGGIGDTATLARAFESPEFILTGLVAREVMLWTGFAIGSRGIRVRRRNSEARKRYEGEVGDAQD